MWYIFSIMRKTLAWPILRFLDNASKMTSFESWHERRSKGGMGRGVRWMASLRSTTLVETLISVTILAVVIGGLLYATIAAKYLINASGNRQEVWNLITSRHEEVSDWSEAYLATQMTTNPWTNTETPAMLLQQGLLTDSPLRNAISNRVTTITRSTNLYTVVISVTFRQNHMGTPTTNLQETCTIYMTPRY